MPLHKHGLEHFNTRVPGCDWPDTQFTRSVNSASLFIHSECELRARALGYAISFIYLHPGTFCALTEPENRFYKTVFTKPFLQPFLQKVTHEVHTASLK